MGRRVIKKLRDGIADFVESGPIEVAKHDPLFCFLLRGFDERGFVFFTNLESAKGSQLVANPRAALVFHWREQERQVRVVGPVGRLEDVEAARYWGSPAPAVIA